MQTFHSFEIHTDINRIQWETVHLWLASTYWSPGIELDSVVKAGKNSSLVIGVYDGQDQVAYMRVVSDRTTFAWICDVFVADTHRSKGIAKAMVNFALEHPDHQNLRRWVLATRDAHDVYDACGFRPLPVPERWMARLKPQ